MGVSYSSPYTRVCNHGLMLQAQRRPMDRMTLNLMFNILNNVAPSYMCDINQISHHHNTCQIDSAYVVPRVTGQGSKSFKFNGSKLWNELPTNVKHAQKKCQHSNKDATHHNLTRLTRH